MSNYLIFGISLIVGLLSLTVTILVCRRAMKKCDAGDWHTCSHDGFTLITDDSWVSGRWYWWLDKHGNQEIARMKEDCIDHFFPPTEIIKEEDVVAWREIKNE